MGRIHLTVGSRYKQNGQVFVIYELLSGHRLVVENVDFGGKNTIHQDELVANWTYGKVLFEVKGPNVQGSESISTSYVFADFRQLPQKYQDEAYRRRDLILPLLDVPKEERSRLYIEEYIQNLVSREPNQSPASDEYNKHGVRKGITIGQAISRASLQRWLSAYEESNGDIRSLVPRIYRCGGKNLHRIRDLREEAIREIIAECKRNPQKRTVDDVYYMVVNRVVEKSLDGISVYPRDRYSSDEIGLHNLLKDISPDHPMYHQMLLLRQQLIDHIMVSRRTQETQERRTCYEEIVGELDRLTEYMIGKPFRVLGTPQLPSSSTVYRRIKEAGAHSILKRRPSAREAKADQSVFHRLPPTHLMQRVELDHTKVDLIIVDEEDRLPIGRPTLTYAEEMLIAYPYAIFSGFEPPSFLAVMNCMLHGILPKRDVCQLYDTSNSWLAYGLPDTIVTDQGREFRGGANGLGDFSAACTQLGIIHEMTPVKMPWLKGDIERAMHSHNTGLVHAQPGSTLSNIIELGDHDPSKYACISLKAYLKTLHTHLLDVRAQEWHDSVGGIPAKLWKQHENAGFEPVLYHSAEEVRILLMRSVKRTLGREGIEFETLFYQSYDLARLRSTLSEEQRARISIKYDPSDLAAVYVHDPLGETWLQVPIEPKYMAYASGLSVWKHRVIRNYIRMSMKREVNILSLADAKQRIQDEVDKEFSRTRSLRGRTKSARLRGIGIEPVASTGLPSPQKIDTSKPEPISGNAGVNPIIAPKPSRDEDDDLDITGFGSDLKLSSSSGRNS